MISLVILLELALSIVYGYFILYYVENIAFFSNLPADGLHDWGILFVRLCYSLWLFHLHNAVKIQPFSLIFLLAEYRAKAFCRLSLWNFKEKSINHFL